MSAERDSSAATGNDDELLFPRDRLTSLSRWSEISAQLLEKDLIARPLRLSDHQHGYLNLLSQLTEVGEVDRQQYEARFKQMQLINNLSEHYLVVVIEDRNTNTIVGASTLFLEFKFIHSCAIRGRLEDVAVLDTYRKKQIGELVVRIIVELARETRNCYKLTLDCKDSLVKFYSKNDFSYGSNMLSIRFDKH